MIFENPAAREVPPPENRLLSAAFSDMRQIICAAELGIKELTSIKDRVFGSEPLAQGAAGSEARPQTICQSQELADIIHEMRMRVARLRNLAEELNERL